MSRLQAPRGRLPLAALALLLAWACAAPPAPVPTPPEAAVAAFARARHLREDGAPASDPALLAELAEVRRLSPEWVAPARLEDDLLTEELRQVEALERRRDELAARPLDPGPAYLAARLAGGSSSAAFARVLEIDPDFGWALHGHAYTRFHELRRIGPTLPEWRRAMARVGTDWEVAYIGHRMAMELVAAGERTEARDLLLELLEELELGARDRAWLEAELALVEVVGYGLESEVTRVGYERGLELLRSAPLPRASAEALLAGLAEEQEGSDEARARLEAALEASGREDLEALRVQLLVRLGESALGRALARGAGAAELRDWGTSEVLRWEERPGRRYQEWVDSLPAQVLDGSGAPLDPSLAALGELAREAEAEPGSAAAWRDLGDGLLAVGWYAEARVVAGRLAELDAEGALELRREARAGEAFVRGLEPRLVLVEKEKEPAVEGSGDPAVGTLEDLLLRWARLAGESARALGEELPVEELEHAYLESPRLPLGPLGSLLHPGPRFSQADEDAGLGRRGDPVPGVAAELARRGRFGLVGRLAGDAPDGVVLRRVYVTEQEGEHLGVPWRGTVAWCEGADVRVRAQRRGVSVAGAALHEGYWIDLAEVRPIEVQWERIRRRFEGDPADPRATRRLERALGSPGLRLRSLPGQEHARRRERRSLRPTLGEADRLRLAVLRDRAAEGALLGRVSLTDLAQVIAVHEEGHCCDRTRLLPLEEHPLEILWILLEEGFSPSSVQERLEYRAELTALCEVEDPRLVLVDLVAAVDQDLVRLGHGPAYRRLLGDLVRLLDEELEAEPEAWPELSRDHTLVHQLHRLAPERVRALGLQLARRERLVAE